MKINPESDHGLVVWGKMTSKALPWAGVVIFTENLNLIFEEKPQKTWVWWIKNNTFSQLNNNLIYDFCNNFKSFSTKLSGQRKEGVFEALEIVSIQYGFDIPESIIRMDSLIPWAIDKLEQLTKNMIGKSKRTEPFYIPKDIIDKIRCLNMKNMHLSVQQNVNNNSSQPLNKKGKNNYLFCMACRLPITGKKFNHPLFQNHICKDCNDLKNCLMSVAKDKTNYNCCICFTGTGSLLILCSFCIRGYCKDCLSVYCHKFGLNNILKTKLWSCFACNENICPVSGIVRRTTPEQLHNVYNMYPPVVQRVTSPLKANEIHVFFLEDEQNNVTKILQSLNLPFKLFGASDSYSTMINDGDKTIGDFNIPKLLIQYYPSKANFDEFYTTEVLEAFFNFFREKNKLQNMKDYKEDHMFWAFETSASISINERNTISRFLDVQPILIGLNVTDVRQRGRFIWSNITILDDNIKHLRNEHIFLRKLPDVEQQNNDDDLPWCYNSVFAILSSLIQNHIS